MQVTTKVPDLCSTSPYPASETSSIKRETPSVKSEGNESETDHMIQKDLSFENKDESSLSVVQVIGNVSLGQS